jgi:UDP:flavonoid glycosyltransferase YjiC (YdhE family)
MRVLFTTTAGLGHIHPTVPLAQAMVDRGHEVLWALPPDGIEHVEHAGIRAAATGTAGLTQPAEVRRRYPEVASLTPAEAPDFMFGKLFGAISASDRLPDLVAVARSWRPHLVVADAAEFAGHIVAAEIGVPSVTKAFGALVPERRMVSASEEVAPLWRGRGLEPRPYGGAYDHLYLDIYPPGLQPPTASHVPRRQLLRPETYDGVQDGSGPVPLPSGSADTPLIYVTMGTVFNDSGPLEVAVDALARVDARVLVTVGPRADPGVLGPQPRNVLVERYVPQTLLLPACDLVISHGGSGTVLAAFGHGLPQVCLPQGADQFLNAASVAAAGAGISLGPSEANAEAIGEGAVRVLGDRTFGDSARRIRDAIATMPSPHDVAVLLETLP